MTRRWNWDFDDQHRAERSSSPAPSSSRPVAAARATAPNERGRVRRRRAGAVAIVLVSAGALVIGLLSSSHHAGAVSDTAGRARAAATRTHHAGAGNDAAGADSANAGDERPENDQNAAVRAVLAYTPFVKEGAARGHDIALTFDDGPGPYTPGVLSVLERYHVHATFFEIGEMLRYFSASTVRELKDGDVIGDHTETHPAMAQLSAHEQREQLLEQMERIELVGAQRPVLFRPPYGSYDATTMRELHALHLLMVLWSVDTEDYTQPGASVIAQRALAGAHAGAIILMHDAGGTRTQTIEALPRIIRGLRDRGYRLVTVPQLLHDDPPPAGQTLPSNLSGD